MFGIGKSKSRVNINGVSYEGSNVSIENNRVYIDGVLQEQVPLSGVVTVEILGDLNNFSCDANATVNGTIKGDVEVNGTLDCGTIEGSVEINGSATIQKS